VALRPQFAAAGEGFNLTADLAGNVGKVKGRDGKFPVLAHALNLGTTDTITTVAWAVGVVRDPILTFSGVPRRAYYRSQHGTDGDAVRWSSPSIYTTKFIYLHCLCFIDRCFHG
jgi:hypothetical protein